MAASMVNSAGRLDRLPIGSFHWRLFALIGAGMFFDGLDGYIGAGVLGALTKSGWSNLAYNAHFVSATFIGMTIGALGAGLLGDRFGRRAAYQINLLVFGLASLAGALAPSMEWLIAARFVMGIGIAAEVVCGYVTIGEFVPPSQRGRWAGGLAVVTNSALFFANLLGAYVIPAFGWRWMFAIVGIGSLIIWLFRRGLPESPRWLESKERFAEAEAVMSRIEAESSKGGPLPDAAYHDTPVLPHQPFSALFSPSLLPRVLVGSLIAIAVSATLYGFVNWLPVFFVKQGLEISSSLAFTAAMTFGYPLGNAASMLVSERFSRKSSLVACTLGAAIVGILYSMATTSTEVVIAGFLIVLFLGLMTGLGWALYIPELFPTELRMRGAGVCNTAGRVVSIFMPYAVVALFERWGVAGVILTLSAVLLVTTATILLIGVETTQRSLEDLRPKDDRLLATPIAAKGPGA